MDMDGAPQAASSVAVNGRNVPMSYGQGDHHVRLSYVTPAEQMLLADVDMYNSDPPHRGPAGIPNFNDGGGGVGGDDGDGGGVGGDAVGDDTGIGPDSPSVGGDIGAPTGGVTGTVGPSQAETEAAGMPTTAGEALGISTDPGFGQLGVPDTLFGSGGSETLRGGESLIQDLGKETTIFQINQDVRAARSQGTSFPELAAAFGNLSNEAVASLLAQQSRGDAPQLSPSLFGTGNEAVGDALNAIGVGVKGFGGTGGAGAAITDPGLSTTASNIQAATAQNPQLGFLTPPASQTGFLSSAASGLVNLLRNKGGPVPENAPRGHFPAYITPNEAEMLRSQGGGVAPGGGQYMVNDIPAFFGPGDSVGGDPGSVGTGPGTGGADSGPEGEDTDMGFDDPSDIGSIESPGTGVSCAGASATGAEAADQFASFLASRRGQTAQSRAEAEAVGMPTTEAEAQGISQEAATATEGNIATGMLGLTSPAVTSAVAHAQAEVEAQEAVDRAQNEIEFDRALTEQILLNPYPSPVDKTAEQSALNLALAATATSLAMDETEAYDAHEAALDVLDAPISKGGIGRSSPAGSWGLNSEVALNNKNNTGRRGISIADLQALNAEDHQGYALTNPRPTEAGILASQVFGRLNPTITNAVIGLAGFLPAPVGLVATLAGLIENKGLLNIPAVKNIPGVKALSDALAGVRTGIGEVVGITPDGSSPSVVGITPDGSSPSVGGGGGGFEGGDIGGPVTPTPTVPATPTVPETLDQLDLTLLPALTQNLPPAAGTAQTTSPFAQPTLPPVFTEQDARALLQGSGQLPLAGIV